MTPKRSFDDFFRHETLRVMGNDYGISCKRRLFQIKGNNRLQLKPFN